MTGEMISGDNTSVSQQEHKGCPKLWLLSNHVSSVYAQMVKNQKQDPEIPQHVWVSDMVHHQDDFQHFNIHANLTTYQDPDNWKGDDSIFLYSMFQYIF